tara:strand:+ start:63 stop:515 length:453 start_codon:yes stop_codon:yes gene_type:complete
MIKKDIRHIIEWTLKFIDMYSEDAEELVFRTGMAETGYRALRQMGNGPALGFFQCEPKTMLDIMENYVDYRQGIRQKLIALGYNEKHSSDLLMSNIALQVAFCRLKYRRDKHPIPNKEDLKGQAEYWKRVYNSHLGKGTILHFINNNTNE